MASRTSPTAPRRAALVGWRLLALSYDLFPVFGLWFLVAATFVAIHRDAVTGGALGLLEFAALWAVTGVYAVMSWRRGGQTLGMRPWRLRVVGGDGSPATVTALWLRYAVGGVSLLAAGLGFWWAWLDRDRLTWHDRASRTRMVREPVSREPA
ncbi:RDD family protein [Lysobacter sp. SG-8]|uniref:RDD family protein n=1 Tax=Marilutibacter penaei TaxID=2759900 RepID=A0A7W3U2Z3_9GAMM|nr:RDD family protein [Lysobacter penaei]MBB1087996.1 RDD family protein [Lysobacter penaei]